MNRKDKILKHINQNGYGIEIGPSYDPVTPKKEGYKVEIIDYMDRDHLIAKYKKWQISSESLLKIEDVDFVWRGESYSTLTGKSKYYDWIIASHVIEHTPDLIGFLKDCDSILKDDGVVSLVIPDKRYCFDHYRPITGISKIIDSHISKNTIPTPGAVAEFYMNRVSKAGNIAWNPSTTGEYQLLHSLEETLGEMKSVVDEKSYIDAHVWCFVPHSFRLIIHDLFYLGFIPFREVDFFPTEGCEFFVTLSRNGMRIDMSRIEMLEAVEIELTNGVSSKEPIKPKGKIRSILERFVRE